jgi:hypothetical protein
MERTGECRRAKRPPQSLSGTASAAVGPKIELAATDCVRMACKVLIEHHPFGRESVYVGSRNPLVSIAAEVASTQAMGDNKQNLHRD